MNDLKIDAVGIRSNHDRMVSAKKTADRPLIFAVVILYALRAEGDMSAIVTWSIVSGSIPVAVFSLVAIHRVFPLEPPRGSSAAWLRPK